MLGVGQKLPAFEITGVKPGFMQHEEGGKSAFETLNSLTMRRTSRSSSAASLVVAAVLVSFMRSSRLG